MTNGQLKPLSHHDEIPPIPTSAFLLDEEIFPSFIPKSNTTLNKHFVEGWDGESLATKQTQKLALLFNSLTENVCYGLKNHVFSKSIKEEIFNEFLSFCEFKSYCTSDIENYVDFWDELFEQDSTQREVLDEFVKIYSFRVSVIYFLKIRFISKFSEQSGIKRTSYHLLNPNSFIIQTFRKASSNELITKAFQSNQYNWFRPSATLLEEVTHLSEISLSLSISEIIKNISIKTQEYLNKKQYSHVFSHKNFGLFINSLLINYSNWFYSAQNGQLPKSIKNNSEAEIISCKFHGQYLESMSLSHWLAQQNNLYIKWRQLLCPDFKGDKFESGSYMKLFNELQFLTFAIEIASKQNYKIVPFLCQTMKKYQENKKMEILGQRSLFDEDISQSASKYDRIVLNLVDTPKNNPYFFLINEIQTQLKYLKDDGKIFLLCNKNIFISSQKEKIKSLLNKVNFESYFSLEDVKGKGEMPSYIFVFNKKQDSTSFDSNQKYSFPSFQFSGELDSFYEFSHLTTGLQSFFRDNLYDLPPYFFKELNQKLNIKFFSDALLDGRFVNSPSKTTKHINHPHFFSNLIKSCLRFDELFDIFPIKNDKNEFDQSGELFHSIPHYQFALVAIVDYRLANQTRVEVIPFTSFKAKTNEYGLSRCQYFGLNPKISGLNLNIFREYFDSELGQQIIDFTFTGNYTKFKSKLSALLFPKLLINNKGLPDFIAKGFELLTLSSSEIEQIDLKVFESKFQVIEQLLKNSFRQYPKEILSLLTQFKITLDKLVNFNLGPEHINKELFFNQRFNKELTKLSLKPLFPSHDDIYTEFHQTSQDMEKINVTSYQLHKKLVNSEVIHCLELYHNDSKIMSLYSDKSLLVFISILLDHLAQEPLPYILQTLQIPQINQLKQVIENFYLKNSTYVEMAKKINKLISSFFIISLNQNS